MKVIELEKEYFTLEYMDYDRKVVIKDSVRCKNWPFPFEWSWIVGHKCSCGNQKFHVCYRPADDPNEDKGTTKNGQKLQPLKESWRNVCPACIDYFKKETIRGELDYCNMVVIVYDNPVEPIALEANLRAWYAAHPEELQSSMDRHIPSGVDRYKTWAEWDEELQWWHPPMYPVSLAQRLEEAREWNETIRRMHSRNACTGNKGKNNKKRLTKVGRYRLTKPEEKFKDIS